MKMKTIEVTDDVYDLLMWFKPQTPSEIIEEWHDEVFENRCESLEDNDFGK